MQTRTVMRFLALVLAVSAVAAPVADASWRRPARPVTRPTAQRAPRSHLVGSGLARVRRGLDSMSFTTERRVLRTTLGTGFGLVYLGAAWAPPAHALKVVIAGIAIAAVGAVPSWYRLLTGNR